MPIPEQKIIQEQLNKEGYLESFDPELKRAFEFAHKKVDPKLVDHSKVKMAKDSLLLSGDGTFYTLQGEGPTLGFPCVFIRLHVCNLRCTWCDAFYTWNPNTEEFWTEGFRLSFEQTAQLIKDTWEGPDHITKRVVFTGGEPLIQRKQIDQVLYNLEGWQVEFETNGTLMPTEFQLKHTQFNVSPKLKNSENHHHSMVKPKVLEALNKANSTFKFVVTSAKDLDEIEDKYLSYIDHEKVIIMPQGVTEEEVSMNAKEIAEPCKEKGFRVSPRLQNILWDGARRGV